MQAIQNSLQRIGVIFAITYRESVRRKLVLIFIISCVLFSLCGACSAKLVSIIGGNAHEEAIEFMKKNPSRDAYLKEQESQLKKRGAESDEISFYMQQAAMQYEQMKFQASPEEQKKAAESGQILVTIVCYGLFAMWCYLLASLFTPFIALNDFYTKSHVLMLASPLARWEYLLGKFLAIFAMVASSLILMLITFHLGMLLIFGDPGWAILSGVPTLMLGFAIYIAMMMLLSLVMGRIPAVVISLAMLFVTAIPGYPILSELAMDTQWKYWFRASGYFFPQYGSNFIYGLVQSLGNFESVQPQLTSMKLDFSQIGKMSHIYSMLANVAWLIGFAGLATWLFERRDLNT